MRSNLASLYVSPPSLDEQIKFARWEIERQEATIARLRSDGHETTDATQQLVALLIKLDALVQMKTEAR